MTNSRDNKCDAVTVVFVKFGDKYSWCDVSRLHSQCVRNLSNTHQYYCITDDVRGCPDDIIAIVPDNPHQLDGWWAKMLLYQRDLLHGRILYLDIDTVIQNNIDSLLFYSNRLCGVYTYWDDCYTDGSYEYVTLRWKKPFNSSVLVFNAEDMYWLYDMFVTDVDMNILMYYGEDKFVSNTCEYDTFPRSWVYSRLYGSGSTSVFGERVKISPMTSQQVWYDPGAKICLMNGPTVLGHYGGELSRYQ